VPAQRQAITILKNLFAFLVSQSYLRGNPWNAMATPRAARAGLDVGRSLSPDLWKFARQAADEAGSHSTAHRLRLSLDLLYATGLRASEIVAARVGDLSPCR
jgi:site-specific recombinase XerD